MIDWKFFPRPIVALAPMADMTDVPFCLMCKKFGANVVFHEMVSSEAIVRGNAKTLEMARIDDGERPVVQQIFGSDPSTMAEAARIIEEKFHPDGIDINMGCPVYKIVSNFDGASLMRDTQLATKIVRAVQAAVNVPVSVKTRLGWSKDEEILDFIRVLEDAGASLVTIHGRTKEQGYTGKANWERIGEAKKRVQIPVLANGDVTSAETATECLRQTNADVVMIGRGALGNPWIFGRVVSSNVGALRVVPLRERISVVREHVRLHLERYGERGIVAFRKHLSYYFKKELRHDHPEIDWADVRGRLVRVTTMEDLEGILVELSS